MWSSHWSTQDKRFALMLFGVFAATAVVPAAIGLDGVLAFLVKQRPHEPGIRIALGSSRSRLLMLVVKTRFG